MFRFKFPPKILSLSAENIFLNPSLSILDKSVLVLLICNPFVVCLCQDSFKICRIYANPISLMLCQEILKSFFVKTIGSYPLLYQLIHVLPVIINPLGWSLCFWTEMKQCLLMQSASISYYLGSWPFMYQVTLSYAKGWHCIKRRKKRGEFWVSRNQTHPKTFQNDFILKVLQRNYQLDCCETKWWQPCKRFKSQKKGYKMEIWASRCPLNRQGTFLQFPGE